MSYMLNGWWHYEMTVAGHRYDGIGHTEYEARRDFERQLVKAGLLDNADHIVLQS